MWTGRTLPSVVSCPVHVDRGRVHLVSTHVHLSVKMAAFRRFWVDIQVDKPKFNSARAPERRMIEPETIVAQQTT
jgi:hypothetical protein